MTVMLARVMLGRRVAARVIYLSFQIALDPVLLLFLPLLALQAAILDLSVTTTSILPFGACYVIMHKIYYTRGKPGKTFAPDWLKKQHVFSDWLGHFAQDK